MNDKGLVAGSSSSYEMFVWKDGQKHPAPDTLSYVVGLANDDCLYGMKDGKPAKWSVADGVSNLEAYDPGDVNMGGQWLVAVGLPT